MYNLFQNTTRRIFLLAYSISLPVLLWGCLRSGPNQSDAHYTVERLRQRHGQGQAIVVGSIKDIETKDPLLISFIKLDRGKATQVDSSGSFAFSVPAGTHLLTAGNINYSNFEVKMNLLEGDSVRIDFFLAQSNTSTHN